MMFLSMFPPAGGPLLEVFGSFPAGIRGFFTTDLVTGAPSAVRAGRARASGSTAKRSGGWGRLPTGSPTVNAPPFASEINEELCRRNPQAPFAAVFSLITESEETWSLRSRGGFDLGRVARSLGDGGHRAAAGFRVARCRSEDERRTIESGGARSSASGDPEV